jgi:peptidoglycan/LPS O-acetylase OafA/YrhL
MTFEPALEGLRGFALMGMLCFHSQFSWAVGGFLPIATFFTLSGYLITSLFLVEWQRSGTIRLGPFWARRFRRLMPAALLTLAAMPLWAALFATADQRARLADDVLWSLFYLANWHFYLTDAAYAALFRAPSPVQHFWSLAIEEQFYFVFPLVVFFGLRVGGGSRAVLAAVLGTLAAAAVAWSIWLMQHGASIDRVYYGSDTRAPELLAGGLLALALHGRDIASPLLRRSIRALGVVGLVGMVWLWGTVHLEERWVYEGGFSAYTLLTVAVIAAGLQEEGLVRRLLSNPVMRWTGRVSYGAYLFHWPVFLALSAERTGLGPAPLFVLRTVVTFGLAHLCYAGLEVPIRTGRWLTGWRPYLATPAAFAAVALLTTTIVAGPTLADDRYDPHADVDAATQRIQRLMASPPPAATEPPRRDRAKPRVAVFGDSTGAVLAVGLHHWLGERASGEPRRGVAQLGCALQTKGRYRFQGKELGPPEHCKDWHDAWPEAIREYRPDVAVVLLGPWEVCDRQLPGDPTWRHLGDPVLDDAYRRELLTAVDELSADGALVIWLTHPAIEVRDPKTGAAPATPYPESDPKRMARLDELIRELEKERPGKVRVLDLAAYLKALPSGEMDARYRPDGTHLSGEGSLRLAHDWLEGEILRIYRDSAPGGRDSAPGGRDSAPGGAHPSPGSPVAPAPAPAASGSR